MDRKKSGNKIEDFKSVIGAGKLNAVLLLDDERSQQSEMRSR